MNYNEWQNVMPQAKFGVTLVKSKRDWIIRMAKEGHKQNFIARVVQVAEPTVSNVLRETGAEEARQWRQQVLDYLAEHPDATDAQVAQALDLLVQTVRQVQGKVRPTRRGRAEVIGVGEVTPELRDAIIEWATDFPESTHAELAAVIGEELNRKVSLGIISQVLISAGISKPRGVSRRRREISAQNAEVEEYIRTFTDATYSEIADMFGLSSAQVAIIAREAGITRPRGRKPRPPQPYRNPQRSAPPHYSYPRLPQMPFKLPKASPQQVVDYVLYNPGATMRDLERQFAMSYDELRAILQEAGVTPSRTQWNIKKHRWEQ